MMKSSSPNPFSHLVVSLSRVTKDWHYVSMEELEKNTEIRDRIARYTLQLEAADRNADEHADLARRAFELSQSLPDRWVSADYSTKRQILEMICLNFSLDGVSLVPEWRK